MPLYEYICEQDGTVLELIRPMAQADGPVDDPAGKGRTFSRKLSTFSHAGSAAPASAGKSQGLPTGGCCPCGKGRGQCSN